MENESRNILAHINPLSS